MADNIVVTPGSGKTVIADEVTKNAVTGVVQFVKIMDGTDDGTTGAAVGADGLSVDVKAAVPLTAKLSTSAVMSGTTSLTPKFAAFGVAATGTTNIVASVSSKKIRVLSLSCHTDYAVELYFLDSDAAVLYGNATNKIYLPDCGQITLPFNPVGWFETGTTAALAVNLTPTSNLSEAYTILSGCVTYVEV